jgi:hypothetical protein
MEEAPSLQQCDNEVYIQLFGTAGTLYIMGGNGESSSRGPDLILAFDDEPIVVEISVVISTSDMHI